MTPTMEPSVWAYLFNVARYVGIPVLVLTFVSVIPAYLGLRMCRIATKGQLTILIAFSLLGTLIGIFTGASREPIMQGLLPAFITFITGLVAYLASKDVLKSWAALVPSCLVVLLLTAVLSSFYGSTLRGEEEHRERQRKMDNEAREHERKRELLFYEKVQLEYEKAQLLKTLESDEQTKKKKEASK